MIVESIQLLQQFTAQRGFTAADLTGKHNESFLFLDTITQVLKCFEMGGREKKGISGQE